MKSLYSLDINTTFYLKEDKDGWYDEEQLQEVKQRIRNALKDICNIEIDDSTLQCVE